MCHFTTFDHAIVAYFLVMVFLKISVEIGK
jgi:hypothetical protein